MANGAKVVIDVGANAGIYSLAALAIQPDATVHAFEPTPEIAARLRATAKLNALGNLHVHEAAVLNKNEQAALRRCRGELGTNEGMNFISQEIGDSNAECVQTVCIDQFCQDHSIDHVDLLKLDIQGQEHTALKEAKHSLRSDRIGTIFTELNWARRSGALCAATESIHLLEQADYLFAQPGKRLKWRKAGNWLRDLNVSLPVDLRSRLVTVQ
jgi:FkbM family methyltransferase